MAEENKAPSFSENKDLTEKQRTEYTWVKNRIEVLKKTRENHYGHNLDQIWADADKDYLPHRLRTKETRVLATDEDRGWRGSLVTLGTSDWQSDLSQSNPFVKIGTALAILVDQNPTGVFTPLLKKFEKVNELMRQLYHRSWEFAKSKPQLKLFVFNLAKYGWACARTYPLRIEREVKVLKEYNEENPEKSVYETKKVVEYNDIYRENLDPRNTWIDDMARPNNPRSIKDWCWRKIYTMEQAKEEFGKYKLWDKVKEGGTTTETLTPFSGTNAVTKEFQSTGLVEVYFYENKVKDYFHVHINGVPVVMESLPITDPKGSKKLSLWQTYWNLRHAESPYGVGVYEAVRYDQAMLDRLRNMTIDQLTISIYKMFFYQGTQNLQDTGEITIKPGVGKQVLDPKNITFLEVPPPGREAWEGIASMQESVDRASGITDPLLGEVTGKTAFELAQAKEAALKRLKAPLDNILEALEEDGYITINLTQLIYSIPEVHEISDPRLISDYLEETQADPDLYERQEEMDDFGNTQSKFLAKVYPEFPLNLDKDEEESLIETEETKFFRIKPRFLQWEGIINIKAQSVLASSQQIEKALGLEFFTSFNEMITALSQERMVAMQTMQPVDLESLPHGKAAKELAKLYDKDPRDLFPDSWFEIQQPMQAQQPQQPMIPGQEPPLFVPQESQFSQPETSVSENPQGIASKIMSRISAPFRKV